MCTYSMVADQFTRTVPNQYPWVGDTVTRIIQPSTREEFDALRRDIQELRTLLLAAKRYDAATGQADCESEEKVALLRRLAELVDVDLEDVVA